jgi:hypothetical protein
MKNFAQLFRRQDRGRNVRTLRLTFTYEGSDVRLVSQQSIEMVPPPSDPIHAAEGQTGFWYELKDAAGRTLYRRVTQNPIKFATEVRSDDPRRPLAWESVSEPKGSFVLLMPDLDQARMVVLMSSPLERTAMVGPAGEIARFDLMASPEDTEVRL